MTLGERIYQYRTERHLSQLEVAEKLEVSRQSVSKWETDGAVPELDKLVKLCELFEVSMDELVRGEEPKGGSDQPPGAVDSVPEESCLAPERKGPPVKEVQIVREKMPARLVVGGVLLGVGLLACIFTLLSPDLHPLNVVFFLPLVGFGVICLVFRINAGLICCWMMFGLWTAFRNVAMFRGISTPGKAAFWLRIGEYPYTVYGLIALAEAVASLLLAVVTLYRIVKFARKKMLK